MLHKCNCYPLSNVCWCFCLQNCNQLVTLSSEVEGKTLTLEEICETVSTIGIENPCCPGNKILHIFTNHLPRSPFISLQSFHPHCRQLWRGHPVCDDSRQRVSVGVSRHRSQPLLHGTTNCCVLHSSPLHRIGLRQLPSTELLRRHDTFFVR